MLDRPTGAATVLGRCDQATRRSALATSAGPPALALEGPSPSPGLCAGPPSLPILGGRRQGTPAGQALWCPTGVSRVSRAGPCMAGAGGPGACGWAWPPAPPPSSLLLNLAVQVPLLLAIGTTQGNFLSRLSTDSSPDGFLPLSPPPGSRAKPHSSRRVRTSRGWRVAGRRWRQ